MSVGQDQDPLAAMLMRIKAGEEIAMEAFYNATVNRVYGLALKIVSRPELAEEVVGDVFMQVWRKARDFEAERAVPMAWLLMICRSRALDRLRREKTATKNQYQEDEQQQIEDTSNDTPEQLHVRDELCKQVGDLLSALNEKQRQLIMLAFYRGMSHQEISDYTGEALGTVKSNLRRAQEILKKSLLRQEIVNGDVYEQA